MATTEPIESPELAPNPMSAHLERLSALELSSDERTITTGAGLTLTYQPNRVTPTAATALGRQMQKENLLATAKLLAKIVTGWDLVGPVERLDYDDEADDVIFESYVAKGEPVPLDPEIMQYLNPAILASVALEVLNDVVPFDQTSTPSSSPSETPNSGSSPLSALELSEA